MRILRIRKPEQYDNCKDVSNEVKSLNELNTNEEVDERAFSEKEVGNENELLKDLDGEEDDEKAVAEDESTEVVALDSEPKIDISELKDTDVSDGLPMNMKLAEESDEVNQVGDQLDAVVPEEFLDVEVLHNPASNLSEEEEKLKSIWSYFTEIKKKMALIIEILDIIKKEVNTSTDGEKENDSDVQLNDVATNEDIADDGSAKDFKSTPKPDEVADMKVTDMSRIQLILMDSMV